jgi:hypothetical protein
MTQKQANSTFETILDHVLPFAGPVLIPDQDRLRRAARQLLPVPYGTIEIRLEQGAIQVDLSQGFRNGQFSLLASWLREHHGAHWAQLKGFADLIAIEGSLLNKNIAAVGLEFDLDDLHVPALPPPSLWLIPKSTCVEDEECFYTTLNCALCSLFDHDTAATLFSNASTLLGSMPPESRIHAIGIMLARKTQALRFQFEGISLDNLTVHLKRLKMPLLMPGLKEAIKLQYQTGLPMSICLDLAPQLLPKIGLELGQLASEKNNLLGTLDKLVTSKLCCGCKRSALGSWAGQSIPSHLPGDWKLGEIYGSAMKGQRFLVKIGRRISHVKLSIENGKSLKAKAYLDFHPTAVMLE